jgi:hypothetical protein
MVTSNPGMVNDLLSELTVHTDKKENLIFLIYKKFRVEKLQRN